MKKYKFTVVFVIVTIFFIMFGFFYDKSNKNTNKQITTYDRKVMDIKNTSKSDEVCADRMLDPFIAGIAIILYGDSDRVVR